MGARSTRFISRDVALELILGALKSGGITNDSLSIMLETVDDDFNEFPGLDNFHVGGAGTAADDEEFKHKYKFSQ